MRALLAAEFQKLERTLSGRDYGIAMEFMAGRGDIKATGRIARAHGLTAERIGQIGRRAMGMIRTSLRDQGFGCAADLMSVS